MTPSLEGLPAKAKDAPSPQEVRLASLDTNPAFQSLGFGSVTASKIDVKNFSKRKYGHSWCHNLHKSNEKTTQKNWEGRLWISTYRLLLLKQCERRWRNTLISRC